MSNTSRISRRTMLRAAGVAIGLPLLEAMQPLARAAAPAKAPLRSVFVYKPGGMIMPAWQPQGEGKDWQLSDTLQPLADLKDDVMVLTGLDARNGETGGNGHPLGCSPWLSCAPINDKDSRGYSTDITIDQLIARQVGDQTRLASLELGCSHDSTQTHVSNISWRGPAAPMGKEVQPRAVFGRLFGDPRGDKHRKSILDAVLTDARKLQQDLGRPDRQKVDEYFESLRAVERRIQIAESRPLRIAPPDLKLPAGVPDDYVEHLRLMSDLAVLALEADATRVITLMYHDEDRIPPLPHLGIKDNHHALVHNKFTPNNLNPPAEDMAKVEKLKQINRFYVAELARMLGKLKAIREGETNLLDNSLVLYGSGLSWGNLHVRTNLPVLLAGRGTGTITPGRHVACPKGTPFANLHLAMLHRAGVNVDRVADSTGALSVL